MFRELSTLVLILIDDFTFLSIFFGWDFLEFQESSVEVGNVVKAGLVADF